MKLFYAHSSRNPNSAKFYESLSNELKKNKSITLLDPQNEPGTVNLDEKMFEQLKEAQIVIVDVTPEYENVFNEHAMIEYGYALGTHSRENILIIYHKNMYDKEIKLPIFIQTKNWHNYENSQEDINYIYGLISELINKSKKNYISPDKQQEIDKYEKENEEAYNRIKNLCDNLQMINHDFKTELDDGIKYKDISRMHDKILLLTQDYDYVCINNEYYLKNIYNEIKKINNNNYRLSQLKKCKLQQIKCLDDAQFNFCLRKIKLVNNMKLLEKTKKDYDKIKTEVNLRIAEKENELNVTQRIRLQSSQHKNLYN